MAARQPIKQPRARILPLASFTLQANRSSSQCQKGAIRLDVRVPHLRHTVTTVTVQAASRPPTRSYEAAAPGTATTTVTANPN